MKFIHFKETENEILVYNHKKEYLGYINYKFEWKVHKQFVFNPEEFTFFTFGCLNEISAKLEELNKKVKDGANNCK